MKTLPLLDQFHSWLLSTYNDPEFSGKIHCFEVKKRVPLAPGEVLDFVSIRHERSTVSEGKELFSVGLWRFSVGAIDLDAINEMCRHLQSFRGACAEVLNQLEMKGEFALHNVGVFANLVGACVAAEAALPHLANGFGDLSFWTYREGINRIEVEPYYSESDASRLQTRLFRDLFEPGACAVERKKGKRSRLLSPA